MSRLSREEIVKEDRPARIPVSEANRDKLFVAGLDHENFMYRWVNDVEGRIPNFLAGWWEFVDQNGNPVGDKSAGTSSKFSKGVGKGVTSYLMRIPKKFWLEDQARKEKDLRERESASVRAAKDNADYGNINNNAPR
jgi:hypothetical protein